MIFYVPVDDPKDPIDGVYVVVTIVPRIKANLTKPMYNGRPYTKINLRR